MQIENRQPNPSFPSIDFGGLSKALDKLATSIGEAKTIKVEHTHEMGSSLRSVCVVGGILLLLTIIYTIGARRAK